MISRIIETVYCGTRQKLELFDCLPGPLLVFYYTSISGQGDMNFKLKLMHTMSLRLILTILSLSLNRVNSFCKYVCLVT